MGLVLPEGGGGALEGEGEGRAAVGAELAQGGDRAGAAGGEAGAEAGGVGALGERVEDHHPLGVGAGGGGDLERAGGRGVAVDLGVALVGEDAEVVALGERHEGAPVAGVGDRPLRVGGGAEVAEGGAVEERRGRAA